MEAPVGKIQPKCSIVEFGRCEAKILELLLEDQQTSLRLLVRKIRMGMYNSTRKDELRDVWSYRFHYRYVQSNSVSECLT